MQRQHGHQAEGIHRASLFFITLALLLTCPVPLSAQEESDGTPKPSKLFKSSETMTVTMTAPWRDLSRQKKNQNPYPAKIEFTDDVKINGHDLEKGKYALYTIPGESEWVIVFHNS